MSGGLVRSKTNLWAFSHSTEFSSDWVINTVWSSPASVQLDEVIRFVSVESLVPLVNNLLVLQTSYDHFSEFISDLITLSKCMFSTLNKHYCHSTTISPIHLTPPLPSVSSKSGQFRSHYTANRYQTTPGKSTVSHLRSYSIGITLLKSTVHRDVQYVLTETLHVSDEVHCSTLVKDMSKESNKINKNWPHYL